MAARPAETTVSLPVLLGAVGIAFLGGLVLGLLLRRTTGRPAASRIAVDDGPRTYRHINEIRPTSKLQVGDEIGEWKVTARRSKLDSSIQGSWRIVVISLDEEETAESLDAGSTYIVASANKLRVLTGYELVVHTIWALKKNDDWSALLFRFSNSDRFYLVSNKQNESYYLLQSLNASGKEEVKLIFQVGD